MPAGKLLWTPDTSFQRKTGIADFMKWLEGKGRKFEGYKDLWEWSVGDLEEFWGSVWKYFDVADADYPVLGERRMPGAKWFEGADVNFAERVFRKKWDWPAIISKSEREQKKVMSWPELERRTAAFASTLRDAGVRPGDRVGGYLPNTPESVVAFLGTASVGAVWSGCSPDFGSPAVTDRFGQIEPKVLVGVDGYSYRGKWFDRTEAVRSIAQSLPSLKKVVMVQSGQESLPIEGAVSWEDATSGKFTPEYEPVPFGDPLWVLYSSGTTGLPKPIVHSQGGIVLELLKVLALHNDVRPGDRFFWFTTTGWMMWNYLLGGLLRGSTIVLYNGSPTFPDFGSLWKFVDETQTTFMGGSAAYFSSCVKEGLEPRQTFTLQKLRGIGSTGSPLSPDSFEWMYSAVKENLWVASISGGTDVCTAFVGGCPILPVYSGEIQCRCLGAKVEAFDDNGTPVVGKVGELVVTEPMPSMPIFLWGDADGSKYRESYFERFPGVWRHGDWIEVTTRGTCIIYGRSDATIKRMGVRIGTSEVYRVVEAIPEVADSLAVDLEGEGGSGEMILFVVPSGGKDLDKAMAEKIRTKVRSDLSPKYVPDQVVQVPSIPRTLNGKKLEVPVKRVLLGGDPAKILSRDSVADPSSLDFFVEFGRKKGEKV